MQLGMTKLASEIRAALDGEDAAATIADMLTALPLKEKIRVIRALGGQQLQCRLWEAVAQRPTLSLPELVPPGVVPLNPVIFHGKNSLPAFSQFRKICFRPPSDTSVLWGYNDTPIAPLIGPGYYIVRSSEGSPLGGVAFDYTQIPAQRLPTWPPLRSNRRGISRLVYAGMIDYMRRVADDVFIGSATRDGAELGSYFIIVRELPH